MNIDKNYNNFIKELKSKIYNTKSKAILSVNRLMIELYFEIGKEIVIKQETLGWGKSVVDQMSKDLVTEFGEKSGYSSSNLWRMRNFYLSYKDNEKLAQLVREISWGQNILIFEKCKDEKIKEYYIKNSIEFGWNRNVLMHHIKTNLFDRDKKENKVNNFEISLPAYLSELARDIIKSEYNLEFLEVAKNTHERIVENALIDNIKQFLLELGYGFSFIGNQYKLVLGENEYFIDLLFFHRKLNALVAVELKIGKFQPEYAGKMNFYLNLLNDTVKMPHENPSIGIIICTDKDKLEVEYALQNVVQPMGISTYTVQETFPKEWNKSLPTKEELEQKLKGGFNA
ncbi:PDDEXK nuclease domain-containing protein [Aliarcobacter butzleri]|uniref:PDDEXK nuclease domain-containing protein n=1 Tax=Aliarcobacter butzleri TaxID=28197 RepID=UPI00186669BF|nr:PDDEXK nuclease domain-containing protein [Aliarcobacter butzleri]MDK2047644.1 PDDEXK nuclease domain-containing protein [Aliarcobacter butzleri]